MLSRVADSLYWMCRYLERAEHTARLVEVHLNLMLDQSLESADHRWRRVLKCLNVNRPEMDNLDAHTMLYMLTFDPGSPCSVVSCITAARENARQVREQISSDMWEQVNRLFHDVRRSGVNDIREAQPLEFAMSVRNGLRLLEGITDSTMNHGEGWSFLRLGRFLERASEIATTLDVHFREFFTGDATREGTDQHLEWLGLLNSCSAFESYCKVYTADVRPQRVAEFLLLNAEFPHSVRFSVERFERSLRGLDEKASERRTARLNRLAGRLGASLNYMQIDEVFVTGLSEFLHSIHRQSLQIHSAIYDAYINYPVQLALEA